VTTEEERVFSGSLRRDEIAQIGWLTGGDKLVSETEKNGLISRSGERISSLPQLTQLCASHMTTLGLIKVLMQQICCSIRRKIINGFIILFILTFISFWDNSGSLILNDCISALKKVRKTLYGHGSSVRWPAPLWR